MKRERCILQFMNYRPIVYSGFDKFSVSLAGKILEDDLTTVFIYCDNLERVPNLASDIADSGSRLALLDTSRGKLQLFLQVFSLFREYSPDIVHMHFNNLLKFYVAICATWFKIPLINTIHTQISQYDPRTFKKLKGHIKFLIFKNYHRLITLLSTRSIAVSEIILDQYMQYIGNLGDLGTLYLGVSEPQVKSKSATVREMMQFPKDKVLIGNVSAISEEKGLDIMVTALGILKHEYGIEDFVFYHVGGLRNGGLTDSYLEKLKADIINLGLEDHYCWLGVRHDVIDLLPAFDIYTQPSRLEGLPVSLMEACSVGLPCVGTAVCGNPEIINNHLNGYVVDPESASQLAEALHTLISNRELRLKMGKASYRIFRKHFNLQNQVQKTRDLYLIGRET